MTTQTEENPISRIPLTRERVLAAAVALADDAGIDALSMRKLGQQLGVEAMSLYNHVANKKDVLNGMVDVVVAEVDLTLEGADWKSRLRHQVLAARAVMSRHPWAPSIIEVQTTISAPLMRYMDSIIGIMMSGGMSVDLTHHAMHALGARVLGFSQELFDDSDAGDAESPEMAAVMMQQMTTEFPHLSALIAGVYHDDQSIVGTGCDDDTEFVFALDLLLDGIDALRAQG